MDEEAFRATPDAQRRRLRALAHRLRVTPFMGDRIRRKMIPTEFRGLPNLFHLELPGAWRALYTVASSPAGGTQVRIVWIGDHTRYERMFGY